MNQSELISGMRDQETDRVGMAYQSLVDLPLNRSRSSQLNYHVPVLPFHLTLGGKKVRKCMWCGLIWIVLRTGAKNIAE